MSVCAVPMSGVCSCLDWETQQAIQATYLLLLCHSDLAVVECVFAAIEHELLLPNKPSSAKNNVDNAQRAAAQLFNVSLLHRLALSPAASASSVEWVTAFLLVTLTVTRQ